MKIQRSVSIAAFGAALAIGALSACSAPAAQETVGATASSTAASSQSASSPTALPLIRSDSRILNNPAGAKATLVLFTDYQCPYCAKMDDLLKKAKDEYASQLKIVVRNFPLPMHQNAPMAAQAVEAAAEQGQLQTMAEAVFAGQASWAKATEGQAKIFSGYAQSLGLDMAKFDQDFNSAQIRQRVAQDLQDANALKLRGTPSVILNGALLSVDSSDYSTIKAPIDKALAG